MDEEPFITLNRRDIVTFQFGQVSIVRRTEIPCIVGRDAYTALLLKEAFPSCTVIISS